MFHSIRIEEYTSKSLIQGTVYTSTCQVSLFHHLLQCVDQTVAIVYLATDVMINQLLFCNIILFLSHLYGHRGALEVLDLSIIKKNRCFATKCSTQPNNLVPTYAD